MMLSRREEKETTMNVFIHFHAHTQQIFNLNNSMLFALYAQSDMVRHFPVDILSCKFKFNKYNSHRRTISTTA